jgi:hypothetical protein
MSRNHEDIRYIIDERKRTVVAILTVPKAEICNELCNIINKNASNFFIVPEIMATNAMMLAGTYRGKAKAHPNDEWNVEEGKKWARIRARKAYMKDRKRIVSALEDVADNIEDNLEKAVKYTKGVLKRIEEDLDSTVDD